MEKYHLIALLMQWDDGNSGDYGDHFSAVLTEGQGPQYFVSLL